MKINRVVHINLHIRPGGGPAGYLYNLNKLVESDDSGDNILKVEALSTSEERLTQKNKNFPFLKKSPRVINNIIFIFVIIYTFLKYVKASLQLKSKIEVDDKLVFHDQFFAFVYRYIYSSGISIMPHQPKDMASEASELYARKYSCSQYFAYNILSCIEFNVYKNADFIILPCKSSIDAYFVGDEVKRNILSEKNIIEVTSSVVRPEVKNGFEFDECKEFVVGFIGRYNSDKGFDRFNELVENYRDNDNIRFLSAGVGDISPISSCNYTDLGWRADIGNIINYCDLLVIPNRVTYFDLLPIESLLLGTPVCVTNVGGNKFLIEKLSGHGVFHYNPESLSDFNEVLELVKNTTINEDVIMAIFDPNVFLKSHKKAAYKMIG